MDNGDFVIVINADKVALTGTSARTKLAYRHSGYPGGLKATNYAELLARFPERAVEKAVRGMLPENDPRPRPLQQAEGLRRCGAPAQRAEEPQTFTITQVAQ